jgi:NADH-quinone oxidoreductase subunit N
MPTADFSLIIPEIFVLTMACLVLVIDAFLKDEQRHVSYLLSQVTLIGAAIITWNNHYDSPAVAFSGTFVVDTMADVLKFSVYLVTAAVFVYSRQYLKERNLFKGEFYVLGLFAVLGMMVLISAHSMLTVYLGLELMSLSLYAMVAFNRDSALSSEAAMKYFILGGFASGVLLYGMSIIYGVTGSLDLANIAEYLAAQQTFNAPLLLGMVFIIVALAFKLGAVPFHMWVPDIYQGAPTAVTAFIGTSAKLAAFGFVMRLLVEGMGAMQSAWQDILIILSVLSLGIGNIIAIAQTNIKRMLAYSTISHVGFILLGFIAVNPDGYSAAMFYTITYAITAAAAFGIIILLSREGFEADNIDDFKGLNARHPWYAFMMLLVMFSMAGVPPTVGFYGKLLVLEAVINQQLVWLAVVAVLFSVIGAFYYLRVIKVMYFDEAEDESMIAVSSGMHVVLSSNALLALGLGLFPGSLIALCLAAID